MVCIAHFRRLLVAAPMAGLMLVLLVAHPGVVNAAAMPSYCHGLAASRSLSHLSPVVVQLGVTKADRSGRRVLRGAASVLRRSGNRSHGSTRTRFRSTAHTLAHAARTGRMSRAALRRLGGSFRRLAGGAVARCHLPTLRSKLVPQKGQPATARAASASAPAAHAAGVDITLCNSAAGTRADIPKDLVADGCFDGSTLYIKNRSNLPLYVAVSGSVSSPSRVDGIPPDLVGALLAYSHQEPEVLPPGYEVAMSVDSGSGGVSLQPASTDILETYGIERVLFGYLPFRAALLDDAAQMVAMLDGEVATARNCLNGANVFKKVWCSTRFAASAIGSIGTFGAAAGIDALKEGPKKIVEVLWGLLQEGKYIIDAGAQVLAPGATSLSIAAAPASSTPPSTTTPTPPDQTTTAPTTWTETAGGETHTWTNYSNAGGYEGQVIPGSTSVQIACKVLGFQVADGNQWWYRIASPPWNGQYYASADAFYNNGQTSGGLRGTPWVDSAVANC
jgi:hypothetical protein